MTYTLSTPLAEAIEAAEKAGVSPVIVKGLRAPVKPGMTIGDLDGHPTGAGWAYWFAREVIKGRFEAGEAVIAKDSICAYVYAVDVIKGRFEEGEAAIAKDAWYAYRYAKLVIGGRFEAGEAAIAQDAGCARSYSMIPGVPSDWRDSK